MLFRRLADLGSTRSNWQEVGLVLFKVHRFRSVWELPVLVQEAESLRAQASCAHSTRTSTMFVITVKGTKQRIIATNWQDFRVYLHWKIPQQDGCIKTVEIGYLNINDELEDELELRHVPDEIVNFIAKNRQMIIDEAEY